MYTLVRSRLWADTLHAGKFRNRCAPKRLAEGRCDINIQEDESCKCMEKTIIARLREFCAAESLISVNQNYFVPSRSLTTNLLLPTLSGCKLLTEAIRSTRDVVYLDYEKPLTKFLTSDYSNWHVLPGWLLIWTAANFRVKVGKFKSVGTW